MAGLRYPGVGGLRGNPAAPRTTTVQPVPQLPATVNRTVTQPIQVRALLANDPALQSAIRSANTGGLLAGNSLVGQQQQALAQFGEAPNLQNLTAAQRANLGPLAAAITPTLNGIIGQANLAGLSTLARLQHAYDQTQHSSLAALAARGALHSGAYGSHAAENLRNYEIAQADARQQLLNQLGGYYQDYLAAHQQGAQGVAQATGDALSRLVAQINTGTLAPTAVQRTSTRSRLNPAAPSQVYTRTPAGYEPKPIGANYG